jgi:hypothetical protein
MGRADAFGRYSRVYELALPYLDTRDNDIHVQISFDFATQLVAAYPMADERVVLPAIILHDIGWKMIPEEMHLTAFGPKMTRGDLRRQHEIEGARAAGEILAMLDEFADVKDEIVAIIDGHDTRREAISLNDQLVKDADKLWRFSSVGSRIDSNRFGIGWSEHVSWLGQQIDGWMFTETGSHLANLTLEKTRSQGEAPN